MLKNIVRAVKRVMTSLNEASLADGISRVISGRVEKSSTSNGVNLPENLSDEQVNQLTKDGLVEMKKKVKLVKYAILLAYQGKNYFGMQIQQNATYPTIESNLLSALRKYGIISEEESKNPNMFYFQRAARTDRAVSAVRQVCSMQLPLSGEFASTGAEKLNTLLPEDIRVLDIRRTTRTFHAQKSCDFRTYSYTLPTYAFAPLNELTTSKYRITEEQLAKVNDVLSAFVGTHNFYNYTARRDYDDQSCKRYMISLKCDVPFIYHDELRDEDVEFVSIYVKGQSFMMHQIRKMIGVTISVIRGFMYESDIQKSFEQNRMDIPKAPGNGLLLEQLHYQLYDNKFAKTHAKLDDWGPEVESRIQQARKELILSEMLRNECATQCMMQWLSTLAMHRVICDPEDETDASASDMRFANALVKQKSDAGEATEEEAAGNAQLQKSAVVG